VSGLTFKQITTVCWYCGYWPVRIGKKCPACARKVNKPIEQVVVVMCRYCGKKKQKRTRCPSCGSI